MNAVQSARKILVVDDDAQVRRILVVSLGRAGYVALEARNGREALQCMREHVHDLVLLDLMMPEVSGWEVLRVRRADAELRKVPVIVMTAARGPEVGEAVNADICALLPKPFELDALHALVQACITHPHGDGAANRAG